jgi:hypothetical protein
MLQIQYGPVYLSETELAGRRKLFWVNFAFGGLIFLLRNIDYAYTSDRN